MGFLKTSGSALAPGYDPIGALLGGGGGMSSAAYRAQSDETSRQQNILKSTGAINAAFDNPARQQQYSDYGNAIKAYYGDQLNQQRDQAGRGLKFALARSGLTAGSTAVDTGRLSAEDYIRGLLGISKTAQSGVAGLKGQDEATRAQLLSMARGGASVANPNAFFSGMQQVGQQQGQVLPNALGSAFGDIASFINKKQSATEQQTAASGIWG